ncbi:MAG: (Fe-S)-binding protein [Bifidobacteriaceae bacterium]|jgi:L-lactate dehydrogenase complex protein LldE|nr:(Fe-S)-binding protein [Bifidobacteriaceae bacterium]
MARPGENLRVGLFATCINDLLFPGTPAAVTRILERLGCRVEFPTAQTCCGQMFTNTGYFEAGLDTVKAYAQAFDGYDYIVGPSGSCVGSVRHQHQMLAESHPALAEKVARVVAATYDLSEFLIDVLGVDDVGAVFPHTVTYHPSCHSVRVAHVGDKPLRLLAKVQGLTLVELPDAATCCGFGGTFSLKNPDLSIALGRQKAANVVASGAEYVVAGDNACLMNIGGVLHREGAGVKPIHLAQILARTEAS